MLQTPFMVRLLNNNGCGFMIGGLGDSSALLGFVLIYFLPNLFLAFGTNPVGYTITACSAFYAHVFLTPGAYDFDCHCFTSLK